MRIVDIDWVRATRADEFSKPARAAALERTAQIVMFNMMLRLLPWGQIRFWTYVTVGIAITAYLHAS